MLVCMNITSEKRYKLVPFTMLDMIFVGGLSETVMLGANDELIITPTEITVVIKDAKTGVESENIVYERRNLLSRKHKRVMVKQEDIRPLPQVPGEIVEDAPTGA